MLLTPAYKIVIAGRKVDTTEEPLASTVEELRVDLDLSAPADSALLRLGNVGGLKPVQDDDAVIELGYLNNEGLTPVFTGNVIAVDTALDKVRVVAHSPARRLLDATIEKTFENKAAGEIIEELAGQAGVAVAQADRGPVFPAFVADGMQSIYRHMRRLADLCGAGFFLYINPDGEIVFRQNKGGGRVHVFEHAKHIVAIQVRRGGSTAGSVEVFGESPGTSRGSESWAWLTKDFSRSKGAAGSATPKRLIEMPVARTREIAQAAADKAFQNAQRDAVRGNLRTFGAPQVQLGDGLRVKDAPDDRVNGDYEVLAVRHRITKTEGFTTDIEFRGSSLMSTIVGTIREIIREELRSVRIAEMGIVDAVYPHNGASDTDNYGCDVKLKNSGLLLKRVPVATGHIGTAAIPNVGDLVLLNFDKGDVNQPIIVGRLYNDEDRPPLNNPDEVIFRLPLAAPDNNSIKAAIRNIDSNNPPREVVMEMPPKISLFIDDGSIRATAGKTEMKLDQPGGSGGKVTVLAGNTKITMNQDGDITVEAMGSMTLKAVGDFSLEAASIKLQSQTSLNMQAGSNAVMKAGAQAVVQAGGSATLQAATVQVKGVTSFSP